VGTLDHLPPLPLSVDYLDQTGRDLGWVIRMGALSLVVSEEDELGIYGAFRLHERVHRINLHLLPSTLHKCFILMDKPFPILKRLDLSTIDDKNIPTPTLPMSFLAPNLHHLSLLGIRLPRRLRLLSSTVSLVTLELADIQASGYFRPRLLVARLDSLPQLEELSIGFSIPIPRPSTERLLLGKQGTAVILSNLKKLSFRGVSVYLERLLSQIRAPVLQQLDITFFNQIAFTLPHLSHFANTTKQIKLPTAMVSFFFFFGTHFILEYKPKAKPSRNYKPLHLRDVWCTEVAPHQSKSTSVRSKVSKNGKASVSVRPVSYCTCQTCQEGGKRY
jgi:hypothetical protein